MIVLQQVDISLVFEIRLVSKNLIRLLNMPESVVLKIGGIPICLRTEEKQGKFNFVKKTADFIVQSDPEITLKIHCGIFPEITKQKIIFETNVGWCMGRIDEKFTISFPSSKDHQLGIFTQDFSAGDIFVANCNDNPTKFVFPLAYPMGELFIMNVLGKGMGVMVHAAGIAYQGKGYLFLGRSGAGKTTIANLWHQQPDALVLNDDKVIIRIEKDGYRIYGTPWHGEGGLASPQDVPLKHIFLLEQAKSNHLSTLSTTESILKLMNTSFLPLWNKDKIDFTLSLFNKLIQNVSTHNLGFLPDSTIIKFLRNLSIS